MPANREVRDRERQLRREERLGERTERLRMRQERRRARLTPHQDGETRRRLLEVASRLFAEHGFEGVTVREICRGASANVAAINYHFGDKLGLYAEVVKLAIEAMRRASAASMQATGTAEERLSQYIRGQIERVLTAPRETSWVPRLMNREMENPTPALDRVVREAIRPRTEYVAALLSELMGSRGGFAGMGAVVASIHGLPLLLMRTPVMARLLPGWHPNAEEIRRFADQVVRFTLAGIRAMAASPAEK